MKNAIINFVFAIATLAHINAQSITYYVSPGGNDNNHGLTINTGWKTLQRVNQVEFQAGDAILFESNGKWNGQLQPKGNGEKGKPITIASFGAGNRPVIDIGGAEGAAIKLVNQSWWEIYGLEITSGAPPQLGTVRQGVVAYVEGEGNNAEHIVVSDCYIHDIWGQLNAYINSAIYIGQIAKLPYSKDCTISDVLVENNRIERVDKCGIIVAKGLNNIVVRKNSIENLGGDAIVLSGAYKGLIEHNIVRRSCLRTGDLDLEGAENFWPHTAAVWLHDCEETTMQFNEVYDTGRQPANGDGEAFDFDFNCKRCVLQYNYSENNHGFLLVMDNTFRNVTRYNVSVNDQTHLVNMFCDTSEQNLIHNNVFYLDYGTADIDYYYGDEYGPNKGKGRRDRGKLGAMFRNNIFYATGQGRFRTVYSRGDSLNSAFYRQLDAAVELPPPLYGTKFYNNCYFGPWLNGLPEDPKKLVANPLFIAPGTGGDGLSTLGGYKLRDDSPCLDAGVPIDMRLKRDFYGNPIEDGAIDIGVHERKKGISKLK